MANQSADAQQSTDSSRPADPLWDAATALVEKIERSVDQDVRERTAVRNLWNKALKAMKDGRVDTMARLLADPQMPTSTELYPQSAGSLRNVQLAVQRAVEAQSSSVLHAVEELAARRGWRSQAGTDRVVVDGLITIALSGDAAVKVQARQVRSLDSAEVVRVLDAEYDRVWTRARKGVDEFATEFAALVSEARRDTESQGYARLQDVYNRLKGNRPKSAGRIVSYYRDEFSADLSCLVQHPQHRQRFQFSAARDPHLAFPVVLDDGTLNQYGYVRLRE